MGVVERALAGGPAKQLAELRKAVEKAPKDTRSLLRLGELEAKCGNAPEACEAFSRAGDLFVAQGFARRAISAFSQGLEVARESALVDRVAPLARALWKLYLNEMLPREAIATIDSSSKWLIERGFDAGALPLLEARVELDDCDVARVRLAETLFRLGETTKASSELVTVFMRLHAQKRRDEALDVAERLLGDRRDKEIARMAAELHLARNRPGDAFMAIAKLRIACEESPTHVPTLQLLARAFELAGHPDKAMRVLMEIEALTGRGKSKAEKAAAKAARSDASKLAKLVKAAAQAAPQAPAQAAPQVTPQAKAAPPAKAAPAPQAKAAPAPQAKAAPAPQAKAAPQAKVAPAPQAKAPPRPSPKAKPKRREESVSISIDIDEAWNELLVEAKQNEPSSSGERMFDPSRQSFWAVEEGPTTTENSVMSVCIEECEIVGSGEPESGPRPVSMLETALEAIESLTAQGRYEEAIVMVDRYLVMRPNNPLLLDKKAEIEEMKDSHNEGPPPALFGFNPRKDSERSIPTRTVNVKAS